MTRDLLQVLFCFFCLWNYPYCSKASSHRLPENVTEIAVKAALFPGVNDLLYKFARKGRRGGDKTGETRLKDASPLFFPLPVVPCASSPGTRVSRSCFALAFVLDQRAKKPEEKADCKGLFAGTVGHIFYADINYRTSHVLLLCGRVVYLASLESNLNNNLPTLLLLNCRWLQMPCAACFQLNVHPGKNSFHRKHTSLDCTYMFWSLLGS